MLVRAISFLNDEQRAVITRAGFGGILCFDVCEMPRYIHLNM